MDKVALALAILRDDEMLEKMAKGGPGVLGTTANVLRAVDKAGQGAANFLRSKGHGNLANVARVAPHVAVAAGGKAVYDSGPVQRVRRKYQAYKLRRAIRKAQRARRGR